MGEIGGDFDKLPEACVSHVLSLTTPRDSCRSAAVSAAFRSAADSDTVWERFLPSDQKEILDRTTDIVPWSSKRDLYFQFCDPILIDGGKMSFHLDKSSGAKCYMISSKELAIVWGDTPHYWKWVPVAESGLDARFPEVACLLNVCWLEIHGKIRTRMLSPNTDYAAYLVFRLDPSARGFSAPVQEASVRLGPHESKHNVRLNPGSSEQPRGGGPRGGGLRTLRRRFFRGMAGPMPYRDAGDLKDGRAPSSRVDGWMEMEMGEFFSGEDDDEVDVCLMEVKGGHWKSGLFVLGMEVRPKK